MNLAILIALLALTGIVYGLATGFKDAANPEGGTSQKKLDPQAARERKQRGRRTFWGSIIVFILVALWYGFMYESPADIEKRQAKERKIGRASCRERGKIAEGGVGVKNRKEKESGSGMRET